MDYNFFKALHIISLVCWFAGLFYLPRLFVYHVDIAGSLEAERFISMESRLYRLIIIPASLFTIASGLGLLWSTNWIYLGMLWMQVKLALVVLLMGFQGICRRHMRDLHAGNNKRSERYFRIFNEVPTVILIAIVILVVYQPH